MPCDVALAPFSSPMRRVRMIIHTGWTASALAWSEQKANQLRARAKTATPLPNSAPCGGRANESQNEAVMLPSCHIHQRNDALSTNLARGVHTPSYCDSRVTFSPRFDLGMRDVCVLFDRGPAATYSSTCCPISCKWFLSRRHIPNYHSTSAAIFIGIRCSRHSPWQGSVTANACESAPQVVEAVGGPQPSGRVSRIRILFENTANVGRRSLSRGAWGG